MAANCGFLLSYWLSSAYAPPSSSDRPGHRLSAPVQHRLGGETPARDAGPRRRRRGSLLSARGPANVLRTHPLVAPAPPARPRSVPHSASCSSFSPLSGADTFLPSGQACSLLARRGGGVGMWCVGMWGVGMEVCLFQQEEGSPEFKKGQDAQPLLAQKENRETKTRF